MLLTYLALVLPLRQIFLRQSKPDALLSPYLWSTLDGEVWRDTAVSSCLRRACARAVVPQFQVAWWRQAAASITKEKFSARERANFDLEDAAATEEVEEEAELAYLAGMSNHSFRTFNHSYAGSTTLTVSTLLHRAHRASQSWRDLFRFDQLLQGKRPRAVSDAEARRLLDACKKARFRARPAAREDTLVAVARGLHNDPDLQLRRPGQRDAMLATVGPRAADDVVAVLATGSGKTLVVMVAAALEGAATTILILPTVALRSDMIGRLNRVRLRHHVWSPGSTRSAPLVIASAEAACTPGFLGYAHRLADRRQLDRIVVDECHLTITASDYRQSMSQLAWYVRQVRTQTVWLTATLPPIYRELFLEHNKLVRPRIVRESTNRPNLRYIVRRERGPGGLSERAARLVQACCEGADLLQGERDRIILYCPTKELVAELADMLDCPSYTADSGTESEKAAIIEQWLGAADSRAIVATSALGPGFDYPHVRWVIHVGPPDLMTNFSQESGRAGRDGKPAESIVLLSAAWQPRLDRPLGRDEEAMQLYLTQQDCSRAVLSRFLDEKEDWRWCMEGEDELCEVCPKHHTERRPSDLELRLPAPDTPTGPRGSTRPEQVESGGGGVRGPGRDAEYAGPDEVLRQDMVQEDILGRFEADLETMRGCCLLCRVQGGRPFDDHRATSCSRRWSWIKAKTAVMRSCERDGRPWMADFAACFWCYLPQTICRRADPEAEEDGEEAEKECRFRDMVMPLCYGAFYRPGPRALVKERFRQSFRDIDDYMRWLGQSATLGGVPCVQAVCVAAVLLAEFG
ncbi:DEAD/DEAH box helicase [Pleurostoma richardsiae]|uniref:DNA 3'-5' helicase n=1 Tax=Pleurostoma richardsiae TaxID=41990 RepID=A0AA38R2A4_9PEZI|nr:DEAD/DEAH box helicase [Pleurostoma richardsiae]